MTDTKSIGDALNLNLQAGTALRAGQLNDEIADRDNARLRAENERLRSSSGGGGGGGGRAGMQYELMHAQGALDDKKMELAKSQALIYEWMHSNDGYQKIAKEYAERLGISNEEFQTDLAQAIVDLSETDPDYVHTRLGAAKRAQLGK
ncbi:hypothetical protein LXA47_31255 [Massilia sp. P8910]|uniref:hypothetical protein n=1 Tax=Massilia antarctica TaxID=2765360 RepID=UPI001E578A44|nr:hypothetical protein [Massilia antarctica]MCE3608049.1 hypothetical protein [Massilia antarctica]